MKKDFHNISGHIKAIILIAVYFIFPCMLIAQKAQSIRVNAENLFSTHNDNFTGANASYSVRVNMKWELGAGIEYAHNHYHGDNGWNLYHLNFIPVYVEERFNFLQNKKWAPYAHLQEGISFNSYSKEFQDHPGPRYPVHESGFYGFAGAGLNYFFSTNAGLFAETGLKGFKLSTNNLDVNPHGITGKLGFCYRVR